ncbi:hypothetical protein RRF57_008106 [Xylaria bambusicola]|uniref:Uncharacterized protein n=1 Tax=Xylaria bambusicola TaxID=326684 RepID=A0AAN7ZB75_9PEZI
MLYVKGIAAIVTKAGTASPRYRQLISVAAGIIIEPMRINTLPVAHGGIDAKMGAKNTEMKKQMPVVIAVKPVRPPSAMPAPDSIKAVTGEEPNRDPIEMLRASTMYAAVLPSKSWVSGSTTSARRAMAYYKSQCQRAM